MQPELYIYSRRHVNSFERSYGKKQYIKEFQGTSQLFNIAGYRNLYLIYHLQKINIG